MTVYSATKAYVSAYTIGAAEELKAKGITVTAVCPGPMATEFLAVGHVVDSRPCELLPYCDQVQAVSYTHLDVYKRQYFSRLALDAAASAP